ncbi:DUF1801 domain-containing protein [Micromonospora sp. PLK6-60]|uniref:DUF1801 domain-containing protein n=1 Tax=Micromonospora sp. PLK6-60 TaxID=2873383 RepID=UPI001CA7466F|nr:DUF1801 domain-containing protein [Micromonospora sp. PLK6-60]MBY8874387.1 DUF1801 domain-containing protein [Micromonospora sp. PLK6-60]
MTTVSDQLATLDPPLREIAEELRSVIEAALPEASAAVWHGHPVWGLGDKPGRQPVCLVKGYSSHVAFGLWRGQDIEDRSGRLVPGARRMASVKLRAAADLDAALFAGWLRQAYALEAK